MVFRLNNITIVTIFMVMITYFEFEIFTNILLNCDISKTIYILLFRLTVGIINTCFVILFLKLTRKFFVKVNDNIKCNNEFINHFKKHVDDIKSIKHDFANHIISLNALITSKSYDDLLRYIKKMHSKVQIITEKFIITGNLIIDTIINNKLSEAFKNDIRVKTNIFVPEALNIDEFDLVVVLGNVIDNAIEASCKLEEGERVIKIWISYNIKGTLVISVTNNYNVEEFDKFETTKKNRISHGIGLKNVIDVIKSNNGFFEIYRGDRTFEVKIMFYDTNR